MWNTPTHNPVLCYMTYTLYMFYNMHIVSMFIRKAVSELLVHVPASTIFTVTQKSGTQPQLVQSLQAAGSLFFSWLPSRVHFSCRSNTFSGRCICEPSHNGFEPLYLQTQTWYSVCCLGTVHFSGLMPVPTWDPVNVIDSVKQLRNMT